MVNIESVGVDICNIGLIEMLVDCNLRRHQGQPSFLALPFEVKIVGGEVTARF